ncbi:DUF1987 domain-containing protein [Pseudoduganella lurida]|nr:DUF1987 domain-containing protein [Pseudoduganella lurida]
MESLYIPATATSPEVSFEFDQHRLSIRGESYPENAAAFYGPVIHGVRAYLDSCESCPIEVNVSLAYFNSSSTKMLFGFFDALNEAALAGNTVTLNWYRDEEDEVSHEFGEELREDCPALHFVERMLDRKDG